MTTSATGIVVPVCSKAPLLYLLTQKAAQKFGYVLGIKDQEHFFGIMKRPCPTFVQIWQSEHPDNIFVMSLNAGQTMGLGMDIENVDYRNLAPTYLPFHPLVELGLDKFLDAVNKLYVELNSHCPLKLWKDRLVAVWGQETL